MRKEAKQAVLFLKKKNQKNFYPFGARVVPTPASLGRMGETHHLTFPANEADGLKLPRPVPNRSQVEKSFFASFFQKKGTCLKGLGE
jgi:hypothetical protein